VTFLHTKHGGHCAFIGEPAKDGSDDGHWAERKIVEFMTQTEATQLKTTRSR
jgi:predicted alpha/beta-fold hydrolase